MDREEWQFVNVLVNKAVLCGLSTVDPCQSVCMSNLNLQSKETIIVRLEIRSCKEEVPQIAFKYSS